MGGTAGKGLLTWLLLLLLLLLPGMGGSGGGAYDGSGGGTTKIDPPRATGPRAGNLGGTAGVSVTADGVKGEPTLGLRWCPTPSTAGADE